MQFTHARAIGARKFIALDFIANTSENRVRPHGDPGSKTI